MPRTPSGCLSRVPGTENFSPTSSGDISFEATSISDAHLAALALEHGLPLVSADTDFARFTDLRWINPFV